MQITSVLVHSLDAAESSKRCSRSRAFTQDQSNLKALRAGGFASGEKRLGVQATLTHCRPLEAHLSRRRSAGRGTLEQGRMYSENVTR
jgi:hypothetical protein